MAEETKPDPVVESEKTAVESKEPTINSEKVYTFNVEKSGFLVSSDLGTLSIVEITQEFIFSESDDVVIDDEYIEDEYIGEEEDPALIFYKDTQSTEEAEEDVSSGGEGSITFDGKKFLQPEVSKNYSTTYILYIDSAKMPKPKLTKKGLISTKLKVEGGLTGDPSDSAAKSGYCPTLKNGKKYHTNKGVTYAVWKNTFGKGNDKRFLNMSSEDWSKIFDNKYWEKNATSKYESVNCLLTSFAWGGNKPKTVEAAKKILNVSDIDSVPEERAVAALISARAQFFINISQPSNKNNKYRKGWINAINAFINETYF